MSVYCWCGSSCSTPSCVSCSGEGSCRWDCSGCGGCGENCAGGCQGDCSTACNTGCTSSEATNFILNLKLSDFLESENITNIAGLAYYEAQRRGQTPYWVDYNVGDQITSEYINAIVVNLQMANQNIAYAQDNNIISKSFGQLLIDKALAAYYTPINLS